MRGSKKVATSVGKCLPDMSASVSIEKSRRLSETKSRIRLLFLSPKSHAMGTVCASLRYANIRFPVFSQVTPTRSMHLTTMVRVLLDAALKLIQSYPLSKLITMCQISIGSLLSSQASDIFFFLVSVRCERWRQRAAAEWWESRSRVESSDREAILKQNN